MRVARRVVGGLAATAALLVGFVAWRAGALADAGQSDVALHSLPVESVGGGLLLDWDDDVALLGAGPPTPLRVGESVVVDDVRIALVPAPAGRVEVLRRPWSVYGHATAGYRRIDFGPDLAGHADGVRDRVLLPDGAGFRLVPPRPVRDARFLPEDRGGVVVSEQAGLQIEHGGSTITLDAGQRVAVKDRFVARTGGLAVEVAWEEGATADAVVGKDGRVLGYTERRAADFVVRSLRAGAVAPHLEVRREAPATDAPAGALLATFAPGDRALLHGARDRLGPFRRGVLPARAADRQLEAAVAAGLDEGWLRVGPSTTEVAIPRDEDDASPRDDVGWTVARSVVRLMDGYDRARRPTAVRVLSGLAPARATCTRGRSTVTMAWDDGLSAWAPSDRSGADAVTVCALPGDGEPVSIEVAVPAAWRPANRGKSDDWTPLPTEPGTWTRFVLPASNVELRLDARAPEHHEDRVAASVAGGPSGTHLGAVFVSGRAFGGWDERASRSDEAASAVWTSVSGDRWRVEGTAPPSRATRSQPVFLRVPVTARRAGLVALDVALPGRIVSATWNDEPVEVAAFDRARAGASRLSLRLTPGDNLLAVFAERPATAPSLAAGGTAFRASRDGRPTALAERVVDRRARAAVVTASTVAEPHPAELPASRLLVERGDAPLGDAPSGEALRADLRAGDELRVAPRRGRDGLLSLRDDTLRVRATGGAVQVLATAGGTLWSPDGVPSSLPLHPEGAEPLWTDWPPGARLSLPGTTLRLRLLAPTTYRTPVPPVASALTLDDDLQGDAYAALDAHLATLPADVVADTHPLRGAVLALDARSGQILACAARDAADRPDPDACWTDLDLRPGSVFKPLVALAALGSADPVVQRMLDGDQPRGLASVALSGSLTRATLPARDGDPIRLRSRLRNFNGRGTPPDRALEGALRASDNVWFGYLGLLLHEPLREGWLGVGIPEHARRSAAWPVRTVAETAGFGASLDLGFGLRGSAGRVPADAPESDAAIAARTIGQDAVRATPLGIATVFAAIAEDGLAPRPTLDPDAARAALPLATPASARRVRDALAAVVQTGTAAAAFRDNPHRDLVIGKTGSSQRIDAHGVPRTDSWFAGVVAPPRGHDEGAIVLVAVLPGAGLGGAHAAEVIDSLSRDVVVARGWSSADEADGAADAASPVD